MRTISVRLPQHLHAKLEQAAQRRAQSKAAVVREALDQFLTHEAAPTNPPSLLELAGDLIGYAEGPGDLSTIPKYMEGFGE